jgi:hypothetical protein
MNWGKVIFLLIFSIKNYIPCPMAWKRGKKKQKWMNQWNIKNEVERQYREKRKKEENIHLLLSYCALSIEIGTFMWLLSANIPLAQVGMPLPSQTSTALCQWLVHSMVLFTFHHSYSYVSLASHTRVGTFFKGRYNYCLNNLSFFWESGPYLATSIFEFC